MTFYNRPVTSRVRMASFLTSLLHWGHWGWTSRYKENWQQTHLRVALLKHKYSSTGRKCLTATNKALGSISLQTERVRKSEPIAWQHSWKRVVGFVEYSPNSSPPSPSTTSVCGGRRTAWCTSWMLLVIACVWGWGSCVKKSLICSIVIWPGDLITLREDGG